MAEEPQTYTIELTEADLEAMRALLHTACITQNENFDDRVQTRTGGKLSRKGFLVLTLVGGFISTLLLSLTRPEEIFGRIFTGSLTAFFWVAFLLVATVGVDRIQRAIRNGFINPTIRATVNRTIKQWAGMLPCSVTYSFENTSYRAKASFLMAGRTIDAKRLTTAYRRGQQVAVFETRVKQTWEGLLFAREAEQVAMVEAFLEKNQVAIIDLV